MSWILDRRPRVVGLAVAVVAGVTGALVAPSALPAVAQDAPVSYDAIASADGLRLEVRTPGLFLSNLFDGGLPVAQAQSNSLGTSQAFAAMPYPGESVAAVSSLLLPLFGLPGLPPYPLQASATHPSNPEQKVSAGVYDVEADGAADGAEAAVTAGVDAAGNQAAFVEVSASTHADPDTGEVVSEARTLLQGAAVAGVISVGRVEASAEVRGGPGRDTETESAFVVEGLSIAGVRLAVGSDGVELLGPGALPLPDLGLSEALLAAAGITFEYLEATEVDGGVMSAGLAISLPLPLDAPYDGTATVILGRARAAADISGSGPVDGPAPEVSGGVTGGLDGPVLGPTTDLRPDRSAPPAVAPGTRTVSSVGALEASTASFYLVLVAAAIVALLSAALIRRFGVKLAWTS